MNVVLSETHPICNLDECWLRKVSKTIQLTSSNTAQHRVLERWLMAIPLNLKKCRTNPLAEKSPSPAFRETIMAWLHRHLGRDM